MSSSLLLFRLICPPAFFRCLSNSGTFMELRTTSFIELKGVSCSDNRVQVFGIPVLLLACSQDWTSRWLSPEMLREPIPITVTLCVLLDNSEWIFGTYKLNVLTWQGVQQIRIIFLPVLIFRFFKNHCGNDNNNKDEENSTKTLNDKKHYNGFRSDISFFIKWRTSAD